MAVQCFLITEFYDLSFLAANKLRLMASFRALFLLRNISQSRLVFRDDASAFSYGVVKILRQAIIAFIRPRDIVFCQYERARVFFRKPPTR